ncbi:hypothetical protein [Priestia endophytica]|uniref:hypothetical protein n=1 Tax=Priestia endophytica TaxID=135735 RepID=UPI00227FAEEC|nr:hypothetical protein [Priestia endophytica]MCY8235061.1 hypothetical protein [Priestia endophytica]
MSLIIDHLPGLYWRLFVFTILLALLVLFFRVKRERYKSVTSKIAWIGITYGIIALLYTFIVAGNVNIGALVLMFFMSILLF